MTEILHEHTEVPAHDFASEAVIDDMFGIEPKIAESSAVQIKIVCNEQDETIDREGLGHLAQTPAVIVRINTAQEISVTNPGQRYARLGKIAGSHLQKPGKSTGVLDLLKYAIRNVKG